jgi:hypothetical protein
MYPQYNNNIIIIIIIIIKRWTLTRFLPKMASNTDLPISTSQVAEITDMNHHACKEATSLSPSTFQ